MFKDVEVMEMLEFNQRVYATAEHTRLSKLANRLWMDLPDSRPVLSARCFKVILHVLSVLSSKVCRYSDVAVGLYHLLRRVNTVRFALQVKKRYLNAVVQLSEEFHVLVLCYI